MAPQAITALGQNWFSNGCHLYSHESGLLVDWPQGNKKQWNFRWNSNFFIAENALENVICKMAAIFFLHQCVLRSGEHACHSGNQYYANKINYMLIIIDYLIFRVHVNIPTHLKRCQLIDIDLFISYDFNPILPRDAAYTCIYILYIYPKRKSESISYNLDQGLIQIHVDKPKLINPQTTGPFFFQNGVWFSCVVYNKCDI